MHNRDSQIVLLAGVLVLVLTMQFASCSNRVTQPVVASDVAPGVILTDVLETGRPRHYWQYEIQPTAGAVRLVKEEVIQNIYTAFTPENFQRPAGAIETCAKKPEANSPD